MVFYCKCFEFISAEEEDGHKTQTKSTSAQSYYSAFSNFEEGTVGSDLNSSLPSSSQKQTNLRVFTYFELQAATRNFSPSSKIGEGSFGTVYAGAIKSLHNPLTKVDVAVKQLHITYYTYYQGHREWMTVINSIAAVQHPNLVKLVGYCAKDDENGSHRLLVYEYLPNRSVKDHLTTQSQELLPWAVRLKVAQDSARCLAYLHEMDLQHIFGDFKSSNILLDDQWNAKLSDFGLASLGPSEGLTHVSTAAAGSIGYVAPEYMETGHLTSKSDVWSYGVFLYELITGRRPLDQNRPKNEQKLLEWVKPYLNKMNFPRIVDPRLEGQYSLDSAQKLSSIANRCLSRSPKLRPKMSEVLEMVNQLVWISMEATSSRSPLKTCNEIKTKGKRRFLGIKLGNSACLARILSPGQKK